MKSLSVILQLLLLFVIASCQDRYLNSRRPVRDNDPGFTTRKPGRPTNAPIMFSNRRPPPFPARFDDRGSYIVKKNLVFDQTASDHMEKASLELFLKTLSHKLLSQSNLMISPFSIYHMLTMIGEGASGSTLDELKRKLNILDIFKTRDFQQYLNFYLSESNTDSIVKRFALFVGDIHRPFINEYEEIVEKIYGAIVKPVNFQRTDETIKKVNEIASNQTAGQITDVIQRDDLLRAQLIVITGLHFKGELKQKFNAADTRQEKFYDTNGNHVGYVDMMFQRNPFAFNAIDELGSYALELEYEDPSGFESSKYFQPGLSMIILLPKKGQSLEETAVKLNSYKLLKLYRDLYVAKIEYADDEVEVFLPKFDIETELSLQTVIKSWGVMEIFDQSKANLTNINPNYYISEIIHKTKTSFKEADAVASATATFAKNSNPSIFLANKPFIYFIIDKFANLILFAGQFRNPTYGVNGQPSQQ